VCLTREAIQSPWINFESGAISKGLGRNRVAPILFEVTKADVSGPLARFQLVDFVDEDMRQLMTSLNKAFEDARLSDDILNRAFSVWWPHLDKEVSAILQSSPSKGPAKSPRDVSDETLLNTRAILQQISKVSIRRRNPDAINKMVAINWRATRLHKTLVAEGSEKGLETIEALGKQLVELNEILGKKTGGSLTALKKWTPKTTKVERETEAVDPSAASEEADEL
jgi:hypothetical protein